MSRTPDDVSAMEAELQVLRDWKVNAEWLLDDYVERVLEDPDDADRHLRLITARDLGIDIPDGFGV